jgi:hypothetical protein
MARFSDNKLSAVLKESRDTNNVFRSGFLEAKDPNDPPYLDMGEVVFHLLEVIQYNTHPLDEAVGEIR